MNIGRPLVRLLRALARQGSVGRREPSGGLVVRISAGGIDRVITFAAATLSEALTNGLVEVRRHEICLSDAGASALRRLDEPVAPFLAQHQPLARETRAFEAGHDEMLVDQAESPLAWLYRRRGKDGKPLVAEHAFRAGERLRADFTRASLMPRVTANWQAAVAASARGPSAGTDFSDVVVAARQRVHRALDAVGPELSGVLVDVCCFLKGMDLVETERRWPTRSAKVVLALALERLAAHYGMSGEARGPDRAASRFWGTDDYRPQR